jgi:hypothetical protein
MEKTMMTRRATWQECSAAGVTVGVATREGMSVGVTRRRLAMRYLVCQMLVTLALLCLCAGSAWAQEVPVGVTTVRVPVVLPADAAIAGAEIGFTQTSGLEYVGFIPASGVQNPVKATVGETNYVGFFSADNQYQPVGGGLVMGELEFIYEGSTAEEVVLRELRLHTKVSEGVTTQALNPGTIYPVTRASGGTEGGSGAGGGGAGGAGGSGSGGGSGGSGSGAGSGSGGSSWNGWGTVADNDGGTLTDENGTVVAGSASDASGTLGGNTGSDGLAIAPDDTGDTVIGDAVSPLAAGPLDGIIQPTVWWLLIALGALALLVLFIVFWRRRRGDTKKEE